MGRAGSARSTRSCDNHRVIERWTAPTERNRLRVAGLLSFGGLVLVWFASATTAPDVTGILSTLISWITGSVVFVTVWMWLFGYGDRWKFPLAITGALIVGGSVATAIMLEPPKTLLLVPFYLLARTLALRWEKNRVEAWEHAQRTRWEAAGPPLQMRDDPLVSERDKTRRADASTEYPATLRELKARLRKSEGDPWS